MRRLSFLSAFLILAGCAGGKAPQAVPPDDAGISSDAGPADAGSAMDAGTPAPVTTANPHGETHTGALSVTLTSVPPATIKYTKDGSDPTTSATAVSGPSPLVVTLEAPSQVTLTFYAVGTDGPSETPHSEQYTLVEDLNPASISGRLFVPDAMLGGSAAILLYTTDPRTQGATPITLPQAVSPRAGGAAYHFEGLAANHYWIAATWWPGAASGNPQAFGIARLNPSVDPHVSGSERADFVDVYIGECDPQDTGVDGVVTLASNLVGDTVIVAAYSSALTAGGTNTTPVGYAIAVGTGTTRPFAMCGISLVSVYLMAGVGMSMAGPGNNAGVYQAYAQNPVTVNHVAHINFQLGQQDSTLGSISGTVHLNGGLVGGVINVAATSGSGSVAQQVIHALVGIDGTSDKDYPYSLSNLPAGTYNLTLALKSADGLSAYSEAPSAVAITLPGHPDVTQDLTGSVGRVAGTVTVTNPPTNGGNVAVVVTPAGTTTPAGAATVALGTAAGDGSREADYVIFGIPDGTFAVAGIVDTNNNGNYLDDLANNCAALDQTQATITEGSEFETDFSITLPGTRCP